MVKVKDDGPPAPWLPRILPEILKFRFSLTHGLRWLTPSPSWVPRISLEILKFRFSVHMVKVKDDGPPNQLPQDFTRNFKV